MSRAEPRVTLQLERMAFRDKQNADRIRIDALEDEVDEKDAEIARLKKELAERNDKKKPQKKPKKKTPVPKADDLPEGDVWDVETTHPEGMWKWGVGWVVAAFGVVGLVAANQGPKLELLMPVACFGLPGLMFLHRRGLTIDRKRAEITRWDWFMFRFRRTWSMKGKDLELVSRNMSPKNGPSWIAGVLMLDDRVLFLMKIGKAQSLARRVAAYLDVGLAERRETTDEIMKRAQQPLAFVAVFMVIAFVIGGILMLAR